MLNPLGVTPYQPDHPLPNPVKETPKQTFLANWPEIALVISIGIGVLANAYAKYGNTYTRDFTPLNITPLNLANITPLNPGAVSQTAVDFFSPADCKPIAAMNISSLPVFHRIPDILLSNTNYTQQKISFQNEVALITSSDRVSFDYNASSDSAIARTIITLSEKVIKTEEITAPEQNLQNSDIKSKYFALTDRVAKAKKAREIATLEPEQKYFQEMEKIKSELLALVGRPELEAYNIQTHINLLKLRNQIEKGFLYDETVDNKEEITAPEQNLQDGDIKSKYFALLDRLNLAENERKIETLERNYLQELEEVKSELLALVGRPELEGYNSQRYMDTLEIIITLQKEQIADMVVWKGRINAPDENLQHDNDIKNYNIENVRSKIISYAELAHEIYEKIHWPIIIASIASKSLRTYVPYKL